MKKIIALAVAGLTLPAIIYATEAATVGAPAIRMSEQNRVPACVTPDRLMAYLSQRNPALDARYKDIAKHYRTHGEALKVRWDYAFFQMILETNALKFGGDVKSHQNNFAGLGATGGGVRGERFADVSSGVLAQIQHLVAYAGERVDNPVATRTRENQDDIIKRSEKLGRAVTFADLTKRWAADRKYIASMQAVADGFNSNHCTAPEPIARAEIKPVARKSAAKETPAPAGRLDGHALAARAVADGMAGGAPRSNLGKARTCHVWQASYGGSAAVLIRAEKDGDDHFTVVGVTTGAEQKLADAFIAAHAPGGTALGAFDSADAAMDAAFARCPN